MTHEEIRALLGAHALGAVSDAERTEIEEHLPSCDACSRELRDYFETLARLTPDAEPESRALWARIAAGISTPDGTTAASSEATVVAIARSRPRWMVTTAAAIVALVVGFTLGRAADSRDPLAVAIEDLRTTPNAVEIDLTSATGPSATLLLGTGGAGFMVADTLPALSSDRTYQLWAVTQGGVISAGVFGPDPGQVAFHAAGDVSAWVLTDETAGGVVEAEGPVVAAWERP